MGWGSVLGPLASLTHPDLLSIRVTFTLLLPTCPYCLQFSAQTSPQEGFVSNVPQWDPLTFQETSEFTSHFDSLRGFFSFLSVSEIHGLSTKSTMGSLKHVPSKNFLQVFKTWEAIWRGFRSAVKKEIQMSTQRKRIYLFCCFWFCYFFPLSKSANNILQLILMPGFF